MEVSILNIYFIFIYVDMYISAGVHDLKHTGAFERKGEHQIPYAGDIHL